MILNNKDKVMGMRHNNHQNIIHPIKIKIINQENFIL
jgi:hypothetical protein